MKTRLLGWDERWFFIEHVFETDDGRVAAVAVSRAALRKGGHWVPTAAMAGAVIPGTPSPVLPAAVRRWLESDELMDSMPEVELPAEDDYLEAA